MKKITKIMSIFLAMLMLLSLCNFTVFAGGDEIELTLGESCVLGMDDTIQSVMFTPKKDGYYKFYTLGEYDTYATLYDEDNNEITSSDDTVKDYNFSIREKLRAGETYYLEVGLYYYGDSYELVELIVEESAYATDIKITQEPYNNTVIDGYGYASEDRSGLEIEVEFSDGKKYDWSYDYDSLVGESYVEIIGDYDASDNYCLEICCDDATEIYYFTTVENTIDYIEYSGSTIEIYENTKGYYDDYDECYYYNEYVFPEDALITVYYTDGTSLSAHPYDRQREGYVDEFSSQYQGTPWFIGGDNYVELFYMGASDYVPVNILPNPVESVEVIKDADKLQYGAFYYPLLQGMKIRVNLKDSTYYTVELNDDNILYDYGLLYTIDEGEYPITVCYNYNEVDGEYYTVDCLGAEYDYMNFEFYEDKSIVSATARNMTNTGEGAIIDVTYDNGDKETFEFDVLIYKDYGDGNVDGFFWTDDGILYYDLWLEYNESAEIIGYNLYFLGNDFYFENNSNSGLLGDADEDEKVNIKDATAIQKHIAGLITLTQTGEKLADADGSGDVNIKDATAIQKHIAGMDTGFDIEKEI